MVANYLGLVVGADYSGDISGSACNVFGNFTVPKKVVRGPIK
jgi:hypothetical protein